MVSAVERWWDFRAFRGLHDVTLQSRTRNTRLFVAADIILLPCF